MSAVLILVINGRSCRRIEHLLHAVVVHSRTFVVRHGGNATGYMASLGTLYRLLFQSTQLDNGLLIGSQVRLVADHHDRDIGAEVTHLRPPFLRDVRQTVWIVDGEADEDNVGVRVGQRSQSVVVLLSGRVPQR